MKIAVLADSPNVHSGARAPIELSKALALNKNNHITLYVKDKFNPQKFIKKNAAQHISVKIIKTDSIFKTFFTLLKEFNSQNYDIISSNTTLSIFLPAAFSNTPVVSTYHGTQWNVWQNKLISYNSFNKFGVISLDFLTDILIWLKTYPIFLLSNKVLTISRYTSKEAKKYYFQTPKPITWGAVSASLKPNSITTNNKTLTIISVSRIIPYKGFHYIIETIKSIDPKINARLIIVGSQPQKNYLKYLKKISTKKIQIIIDPSDRKLARLYQSADIYATCDKYLFFGMPILEAASFQLPSIALNHAAAKEVIQNQKTGFVANNLLEFKKYLELLLTNHKKRSNMGKNAAKFAKNFTWEETASEYEKVFKSVIKKNRSYR